MLLRAECHVALQYLVCAAGGAARRGPGQALGQGPGLEAVDVRLQPAQLRGAQLRPRHRRLVVQLQQRLIVSLPKIPGTQNDTPS